MFKKFNLFALLVCITALKTVQGQLVYDPSTLNVVEITDKGIIIDGAFTVNIGDKKPQLEKKLDDNFVMLRERDQYVKRENRTYQTTLYEFQPFNIIINLDNNRPMVTNRPVEKVYEIRNHGAITKGEKRNHVVLRYKGLNILPTTTEQEMDAMLANRQDLKYTKTEQMGFNSLKGIKTTTYYDFIIGDKTLRIGVPAMLDDVQNLADLEYALWFEYILTSRIYW